MVVSGTQPVDLDDHNPVKIAFYLISFVLFVTSFSLWLGIELSVAPMELTVRVILHRSNPSVKISLKRHFWQGNPPVVDWLGQMVVIFIIYNSFEGSVSGKSKVGSNGVQQDQTKSDVFKSIFSSHSSAQNKPKGHWVTFDPRYNWKQHLSHFNKLSVPFLSLTELLWLYIMYCVQRIP